MNKDLFLDFTYGNYIVSTVGADGRLAGAAMNTVFQLTEDPWLVAICFNHVSTTGRLLRETHQVAITVMGQDADMAVEDLFGTCSSDEVDKFAQVSYALAPNGAPYLTQHARSWFSGSVEQVVELPTHTLFLVNIKLAGRLSTAEPPMTYADYRRRKEDGV